MKTAVLIYPHQLYHPHPLINADRHHMLIEDPLFFGDSIYPARFHKLKLMLHRASMERKNAIALRMDDHHNAGAGYQNLAEIYLYLGELDSMKQSLEQALEQAQLVVDERQRKQAKIDINCYLGLVYHLLGNVTKSSEIYEQAEHLQREIIATLQYHYSIDGIRHDYQCLILLADDSITQEQIDFAQQGIDRTIISSDDYKPITDPADCGA